MNSLSLHDELDVFDAEPVHDLDRLLTDLERPAKDLLQNYSARVLVRTERRRYQLRSQTADHWPHTLPNDAPPEAERAAELLRHIRYVRDSLQHDAMTAAIWHALHIGLLSVTPKSAPEESFRREAS
jgi:hypothetical protein